jgi:hypothetical protein
MVSRTRNVDGTDVEMGLQIVLEGCLHESGIVKARRGGQTAEGGCFCSPRRDYRSDELRPPLLRRLSTGDWSPLSHLQRMQQLPSFHPPAQSVCTALCSSQVRVKAMLAVLKAPVQRVESISSWRWDIRCAIQYGRRLGREWYWRVVLCWSVVPHKS